MANALSVPAASSSGAATSTAIVGDNPTPYGSAVLGATTTDSLTTGDLQVGDAGELGGCTEMAFEFWFLISGSMPGIDGTIAQGPLSSSGATRQFSLTLLAAGNLQFKLLDETGANTTLTGGTSLTLGVWHHIVCTAKGGFATLYLDTVSDAISSGWGLHSVRPLGTTAGSLGFELIGPAVGGINFLLDEVAVYRTGLSAVRVAEHYRAGRARGFAVQLPGERITAVLDSVSSHAPRSIQAGTRTVIPRYMTGQAPLEECRRAVEAEDVDAALFVAANGTVTFLADGHRSSAPYNTIQATFGDGAGELAYVDVETDYSEIRLINEWNVTRSSFGTTTAATQTASDATSISRYFKRSMSISDVPTTTDANCATIAASLLAKYKDPFYRITSISFNTIDPDVTEAVLQRELMDKIRILRTPPGGGARIQQDAWIQKIEIAGSSGEPWTIRWTVEGIGSGGAGGSGGSSADGGSIYGTAIYGVDDF